MNILLYEGLNSPFQALQHFHWPDAAVARRPVAIKTRGAARAPAGPTATGAVEEVPRTARNPIFGRGRHSERRAHGRRRSRRIGRPGLVAAFCNETEGLFGYELVPRVRVDVRARFLVARRFRGEPRMRAVRRRHSPENSTPGSWEVVPATLTLRAPWSTCARLSAAPEWFVCAVAVSEG